MSIVHTFDKDGAFIAGDTETGKTCYAYPSSDHANAAKRRAAKVAKEMMDWENRLHTVPVIRVDYDQRHWLVLENARATDGRI